jgi:drug/metabolite transporter (DMT)-like permease
VTAGTVRAAGTPAPALMVACVAATWLVWGSTYFAIRVALGGFPPFFLMGSRFVVAGVLALAYAALRGSPLPTRPEWRNAAVVGALMLGGGMGGTAFAEQTIGSGIVVAFIAINPALLTLLHLPFGVRPTRRELAGVLIGFAGVVLLVGGASFRASPPGLLAMVAGCTGWSLGSLLSQHACRLAPGVMGYASEMLCGGLFLLALSAVTHEHPAIAPLVAPGVAWSYLVVFGSLVAFTAYMVLLGQRSPALATSYTYVNPVIAIALGTL